MVYLNDFSLSMLGPEGLGRSGAAHGDKAGWLTVQGGRDQLTACCRNIYTQGGDYKLCDLMLGSSLILGHWPWEECSTFELLVLDKQQLFTVMLSG